MFYFPRFEAQGPNIIIQSNVYTDNNQIRTSYTMDKDITIRSDIFTLEFTLARDNTETDIHFIWFFLSLA